MLEMAEDKKASDLLFTTDAGSTLHRTSITRSLKWEETGQGRQIHDLRHTAACLWLSRRVDPGIAQAWMGHEYGLDRLNEERKPRPEKEPGKGSEEGPGATRGAQVAGEGE